MQSPTKRNKTKITTDFVLRLGKDVADLILNGYLGPSDRYFVRLTCKDWYGRINTEGMTDKSILDGVIVQDSIAQMQYLQDFFPMCVGHIYGDIGIPVATIIPPIFARSGSVDLLKCYIANDYVEMSIGTGKDILSNGRFDIALELMSAGACFEIQDWYYACGKHNRVDRLQEFHLHQKRQVTCHFRESKLESFIVAGALESGHMDVAEEYKENAQMRNHTVRACIKGNNMAGLEWLCSAANRPLDDLTIKDNVIKSATTVWLDWYYSKTQFEKPRLLHWMATHRVPANFPLEWFTKTFDYSQQEIEQCKLCIEVFKKTARVDAVEAIR